MMQTQTMFSGAGLHRVRPPIRWAWMVALGVAVIFGAYDRAARRACTASTPHTAEVSSAPAEAGGDEKRT